MWSTARTVLYSIAIFSAFLTFVLAAAFVGRTNNDFGLYNEGAAALIAFSLILLGTLPILHFLFHRRGSTSIVGSLAVEIGLLFVLWAMFLGGAAAVSDHFGGLSYCRGNSICDLGRSVQAFAWITWITLTFLLAHVVVSAVMSRKNGNQESSMWTRPLDTTHVKFGSRNEKTTSTNGIARTKEVPTTSHTSHTQAPVLPPQQAQPEMSTV